MASWQPEHLFNFGAFAAQYLHTSKKSMKVQQKHMLDYALGSVFAMSVYAGSELFHGGIHVIAGYNPAQLPPIVA